MSVEIIRSPEVVESPLLQELEAERREVAVQAARNGAAKHAFETIPEVTATFKPGLDADTPDMNRAIMHINGTEDDPTTRIEIGIIRQAAEQTGTPISLADDAHEPLSPYKAAVHWYPDHEKHGFAYSDPGRRLRQEAQAMESKLRAPLSEMAAKIQAGEQQSVTDAWYDLSAASQDVVFSFMASRRTPPQGKSVVARTNAFTERLRELPVHFAGEGYPPPETSARGIYVGPDGSLVKILTEPGSPGAYTGMYFAEGTQTDPTVTPFRLGIEIDERRAGLEISNARNSKVAVAEPFLTTQTGREITNSFDSVGLRPTGELRNILEANSHYPGHDFSITYGNSYSELTRELAKYVGQPDRSFNRLFEGDESDVRTALSELAKQSFATETGGAIFHLIGQLLSRTPESTGMSDVPVYEGEVSVRAQSCKDAESYYEAAITGRAFALQQHGDVTMLHKRLHEKSALSLTPVRYKGITLPAGSLFQVHKKNGSYAFVRLTSFCFSHDAAADAYTWQYDMEHSGKQSNNFLPAPAIAAA